MIVCLLVKMFTHELANSAQSDRHKLIEKVGVFQRKNKTERGVEKHSGFPFVNSVHIKHR